MSHGGEEGHVFSYLFVVFRFGGAKLKVNDYPFSSVGHYTIRASFSHLSVFDGEDGALVKECPTRGEPISDLRMTEAFAEHIGDALGGD
jgi:hypothetical protein